MDKQYNIEELFGQYSLEPQKWLSILKEKPELLESDIVELIISSEKDKDANPYYSSNTRLKSCCDACMELIGYTWEVGNIKTGNCDMNHLLNNNVFTIDRVAGGHRRLIDKDTQIEMTVFLRPHTTSQKFKEVAIQICERNGVNYSFKEQEVKINEH